MSVFPQSPRGDGVQLDQNGGQAPDADDPLLRPDRGAQQVDVHDAGLHRRLRKYDTPVMLLARLAVDDLLKLFLPVPLSSR